MKYGILLLICCSVALAKLTNPISDATILMSDITTNNFSTTQHGFVPKGTNVGNFLKDDGTWAAAGGGGGGGLTVVSATSSAKTPSASNNYHQLTGNSISLTSGTWEVTGYAKFSFDPSTPAYTDVGVGFYGANGADTSAAPVTSLSGVSGITLYSAYTGNNTSYINTASSVAISMPAPTTIFTLTSTQSIYIVTYATMTTAANARITAYISARKIFDGSSSEANTASNVGAGSGLYSSKSGVDLQFKTLTSSSSNISITSGSTTVDLNLSTTPTVDAFATQKLSNHASAPSSGYLTLYTRKDNNLYAIQSSGDISMIPSFYRSSKVASTDQSAAGTTFVDSTYLVSDVLPPGTYQWEVKGAYQTSATTLGIGFRMAAGTATVTDVIGAWNIRQAANGTGSLYTVLQEKNLSSTSSTSVVAQNTSYPFFGDGIIKLSTSGTVKVQFAPETGTVSNVMVVSGTSMVIQRAGNL